MDFLRELVSQEKVRYIDDQFNLDLTYITPRIIAMAYPAEGFESMFRNKISDVAEFFNTKHDQKYLIINCSNRKYDYSYFQNKVQDVQWPNHYPCPILTFFQTILTSANFLLSKNDHVVAVHCLAGKGRTGSLITAILYISGRFKTIEDANNYYLCKRAVHVDRPSQLRYLNYFKDFYDIGFKNMNFGPKVLSKIIIKTSELQFFEQRQNKIKVFDFERDSLQLACVDVNYEDFQQHKDGYVFIKEINQTDNYDSTEILVNLFSKGLVKMQKIFRVNYSLFFVNTVQVLEYDDLDVPHHTLPKDFRIELYYKEIDNVELLQNWIFQFKDVLTKLEDIKKVLDNYNQKESISAHIDSGKTTFTERVLYYAGRINSIHEVKGSDGVGATMDFMELEKERGITIQSAATQLQWRDYHINLIDTPGHVDFTIEVERALRVLDGAVLIVCGVSGVQAQTFTVYKQMQRYKVPRIIFINKLDRLGANVYRTTDQIKQRLGINAELTQIPIGEDSSFSGIIDLIHMKCFAFEGPNGNIITEQEIPENMLQLSQEKRQKLLETLADNNEQLMEKIIEEQEISVQEIKDIIRQQTLKLKFSPIFIGSAYKNKGVQSALDGVLDYLPSPEEIQQHAFKQNIVDGQIQEEQVELSCDNKEQFICLAFKLEENRFGQLTFCRVYQGKVKSGDNIWNVREQKQVKISRMVKVHADKIEDIKEAKAGDIFALFGIECSSGTTFIKNHKDQIMSLQTMFVPDPVISLSLKPENKNNLQNLQKALTRFSREDPTFTFQVDSESEEMIISGMGELHLQIYCERIKREYDTKVIVGQPIVSYRETVQSKVEFDYLHKKQSGGAGQYAKIIGDVQPLNDLQTADQEQLFSNLFVNQVTGQSIPMEYITAVEKQFYDSCSKGPLTGYPMINLKFTLKDGQTHVVDSSQSAFQTATKYALFEVFKDSAATLLEPTMKVEISVPVDCYQPVMNSITKRGGDIVSTQTSGEYFILEARVTLENMFGFSSELRGFTQGQGEFSMEYLNHTPVPVQNQQDIIEKIRKHRKEN